MNADLDKLTMPGTETELQPLIAEMNEKAINVALYVRHLRRTTNPFWHESKSLKAAADEFDAVMEKINRS